MSNQRHLITFQQHLASCDPPEVLRPPAEQQQMSANAERSPTAVSHTPHIIYLFVFLSSPSSSLHLLAAVQPLVPPPPRPQGGQTWSVSTGSSCDRGEPVDAQTPRAGVNDNAGPPGEGTWEGGREKSRISQLMDGEAR